jgi:hypothetical protein
MLKVGNTFLFKPAHIIPVETLRPLTPDSLVIIPEVL